MKCINKHLTQMNMKTTMMMLCLVLGGWGAFAQHDHA